MLTLSFNRPKQSRSRHHKVRTGCVTCKSRHVKCDENQPICGQCKRSGRDCEGYKVPKAFVFDVCDDPAERRSYHFFREKAASELSSYFAVPFWNGIVLQLASSQPALQHAVAGIGALYETLNEVAIHNGQPLSQYGVLQRQLALRQSNKAIKLLRSAKPADLNLETLLVACILFICQENMFGEWFSVLYHLEAGLGLLKGHKRKDRKVPLALSPDMIEEHIMPVIARLESQYTMLHPSTPEYRTFYLPPADAEFPVFQFPVEFNNLIEANGCFERLNRHIYYQYACQTRGKTHEPLVHAELIPLGLRQLQQWAVLFEGFIRTQSKSPSDAELRAIAYLRVHHHFSRILVQTLPFNDEMVMDRYTEDFRTIIVHAAEFIRLTVKASNSGTLTSVFAIEPHIVRTLHMVGIHCRHPSIRREAVRLLREYDRQEGPFGSLISAAVSERCRVIEERGLGEVKYCSEIPECNRIRLVAGTISGLPNSSRSSQPASETLEDEDVCMGFITLEYVRAPYDSKGPLYHDPVPWMSSYTNLFHRLQTGRTMIMPEDTKQSISIKMNLPCGCDARCFPISGTEPLFYPNG